MPTEYSLVTSGGQMGVINDALLIKVTAIAWRQSLDKTTPINKTPQNAQGQFQVGGVRYMRTRPGNLRNSWRFRELPDQMAVEATNKQKYAKIQQEGGVIPPLDLSQRGLLPRGKSKGGPKRTGFGGAYGRSRVMYAFVGGAWRFFTKRGAIRIRGQHFIEPSVQMAMETVEKLRGVQWAEGSASDLTKREAA